MSALVGRARLEYTLQSACLDNQYIFLLNIYSIHKPLGIGIFVSIYVYKHHLEAQMTASPIFTGFRT